MISFRCVVVFALLLFGCSSSAEGVGCDVLLVNEAAGPAPMQRLSGLVEDALAEEPRVKLIGHDEVGDTVIRFIDLDMQRLADGSYSDSGVFEYSITEDGYERAMVCEGSPDRCAREVLLAAKSACSL